MSKHEPHNHWDLYECVCICRGTDYQGMFRELHQEYESIAQASKETGIKNTNISNCLSERSKSAGGFQWKYKNTQKEN